MNILFLCEGEAESYDSWSGISKSIVDQLRRDGHTVDVGNVELFNLDRWLGAASTFSTDRRRWKARYDLQEAPFRLRSRRASRHIARRRGLIDLILQVGATFEPLGRGGVPYCLCCDSNIRVAQQGASSGYSDGTALTESELEDVARRERRVYQGAAAIFPLSERLRRSFIHDFGIPAERVRAILAGPNLDLRRIPANTPARPSDAPPTVLFVGRQFYRKGGDVLLESFRRVRAELQSARLIVAGAPVGTVDGPGITCLGNLDKNALDGWNALTAAYASADVFALPTRFEPFGVAFVEAMHFGLPCIGPDAWAVPEIIADGETGFTVPVDDVEVLADRLLQLLRDPVRARAMGEAGRARARRLFTWPNTIERMSGLMAAAVQGASRVPATA
jgi:alpha-maltose-1-phosphate synthase